MVVLSLENAQENMKGWLCRYLYQIRPGLYVGDISAKIRNLIWEKIETSHDDVNAVLLWSDNNEQGFSSKTIGDPRRRLETKEGIQWITIEKELSHYLLKAKTGTKKELICHLLETGIMAKAMLEEGPLVPIRKQMAEFIRETEEETVLFICFAAAIHDIGKIHPHFQKQIDNAALESFSFIVHDSLPFRHEQYGEWVIENIKNDHLDKMPAKKRMILSESIALHHQGHKKKQYYPPAKKDAPLFTKMQNEVIDIVYDVFPFELNSSKIPLYNNAVSSMLAAIINLSDWIASSYGVFSEISYEKGNEYIEKLKEQAHDFLSKNYMLYQPNEKRFHNIQSDSDFFQTFNILKPRPLQNVVAELCRKSSKGTITFVEAPCGEGKTVAALYAVAHQNPNANGFYMALPTAATSESIHGEVSLLCEQADPKIKLPVFNGRAWLSDKDITLDKELWLSPSRQKLFYPVAVGTVDQLIASVLKTKYGLLRLLALMGKTIIIDEMHAYDIYMKDALKIFLQYCGIFGVSVIILSATLLSSTKEELLSAYTGYMPDEDRTRYYKLNEKETTYEGKWEISDTYPLVTMATNVEYRKNVEIYEKTFDVSKKQDYTYELVKIKEDEDQNEIIAKTADKKVRQGGCLAVIMNTVDAAKDVYRRISQIKEEINSDVQVFLLIGRNTAANKAKASDNVKLLFGKNRSHRPRKAIVVSTQIIEQSMDVDFDFMITQLAPMDLLIQRFGRYHRHSDEGTIRAEKDCSEDSIQICVPEGKEFQRMTYIYDGDVLQQTVKTLEDLNEKHMILPDDTRTLVDGAYPNNETLSVKDVKKHFAAEWRTISDPKSSTFSYYDEADSLYSEIETRFSDFETIDIAVVPKDIFEKLKEDEADLELSRDIMKNYVITGVPAYLLYKNDESFFSKESMILPGTVNGFLRSITFYRTDNDYVYGNGCKMYIDDIFGLEIKEE